METQDALETAAAARWPVWVIPACLVVTAVMVVILRGMGRVWWCKGGEWWIWAGDIWSMHASQHFLDPYSFTHVLHGVMFYAILSLLLGNWVSVPVRFLLAISLEASWEILENTNFIIQKYREATISLDYFGDSILNSIADVLCCAVGFLLAWSLPVWASAGGFIVLELFLAWWIRDGLVLNLIMLIAPVQAIKDWQMGAAPPG